MIASNFTIKESIYLVYLNAEYDLHNDFDFEYYSYDVKKQRISLRWKKATGDWVSNNLPSDIEFDINGVSSFSVCSRRKDAPSVDDVCLEEIAYENDEEWCNGPFWVDSLPEKSWRWLFMFESDYWLTIDAESVSVEITP